MDNNLTPKEEARRRKEALKKEIRDYEKAKAEVKVQQLKKGCLPIFILALIFSASATYCSSHTSNTGNAPSTSASAEPDAPTLDESASNERIAGKILRFRILSVSPQKHSNDLHPTLSIEVAVKGGNAADWLTTATAIGGYFKATFSEKSEKDVGVWVTVAKDTPWDTGYPGESPTLAWYINDSYVSKLSKGDIAVLASCTQTEHQAEYSQLVRLLAQHDPHYHYDPEGLGTQELPERLKKQGAQLIARYHHLAPDWLEKPPSCTPSFLPAIRTQDIDLADNLLVSFGRDLEELDKIVRSGQSYHVTPQTPPAFYRVHRAR